MLCVELSTALKQTKSQPHSRAERWKPPAQNWQEWCPVFSHAPLLTTISEKCRMKCDVQHYIEGICFTLSSLNSSGYKWSAHEGSSWWQKFHIHVLVYFKVTNNLTGPDINFSFCLFLQEWKERGPPALTVGRLTEMHTGDPLHHVRTPTILVTCMELSCLCGHLLC